VKSVFLFFFGFGSGFFGCFEFFEFFEFFFFFFEEEESELRRVVLLGRLLFRFLRCCIHHPNLRTAPLNEGRSILNLLKRT